MQILLLPLMIIYYIWRATFGVIVVFFWTLIEKFAPFFISTLITFCVIIFAVGRKIFCGENLVSGIEKILPQRESPRQDFLLAVIELFYSLKKDMNDKFQIFADKLDTHLGLKKSQ